MGSPIHLRRGRDMVQMHGVQMHGRKGIVTRASPKTGTVLVAATPVTRAIPNLEPAPPRTPVHQAPRIAHTCLLLTPMRGVLVCSLLAAAHTTTPADRSGALYPGRGAAHWSCGALL